MAVWMSFPPQKAAEGAESARLKQYLLFFVPGNPGLVEYYATFFAALRKLLDDVEATSDMRFTILGRNLLGFDDSDDGKGEFGPRPFNLDTQIRAMMDAVADARIGPSGGLRQGEPFDEVFIAGHSVGSYISLEIFRRHQEMMQNATKTTETGRHISHLRLRAGFLLFATLTHIARSPSGRKLGAILGMPLVGPYVPQLAKSFLSLLPVQALHWIVTNILGFPPHAAGVTTQFLVSDNGVRQALYLGGDELATICHDEWEDEVWEVAEKEAPIEDDKNGAAPKFVVLFGQNDHWIDNGHRDQFIARRAEHTTGRVRIVMDERGLPHAFCIKHGEEVAELVGTWVTSILENI